jgi:mannose/cellobiose epimerase-like protein (N-acyl-D-glucosamine 2-epimerase family)
VIGSGSIPIGQNSNMHLTEPLMTEFEAINDGGTNRRSDKLAVMRLRTIGAFLNIL